MRTRVVHSYTIEERDGDGWNMIVNSDGSSFDGRHPGMPNRMGDAWVPARFRDRPETQDKG